MSDSILLLRHGTARTTRAAAGALVFLIAQVRPVPAQTVAAFRPGFEFLVSSGSLIPTGGQRVAVTRADLTAAQLSYVVRPSVALTATLGWARSHDIAFMRGAKLDVFTYDVGVEGRAKRWISGDGVFVTPFVGLGAGGRMYNYRRLDVDARHNLAAYGSTGVELGYRRIRLRVEARDYVTGFAPLTGIGPTARRNDVAVVVGLRITGRER